MNARDLFRRAPGPAVALIIAGLTIWGCEHRDVVTGAESRSEAARIPDISDESGRIRSHLYDPWNPYTAATVERLLCRSDVDVMIDAFAERGMELAPEDCLVIEGEDDDGLTRITLIGLTHHDPGVDEIGVLACFERNGTTMIAPGALTSTRTRRGGRYVKLADGLWMDTGPVPPATLVGAEAERWEPDQWNKFWECALTYAPGPVSACFVGCFFVGPGYLQCAMACVSTQALSVVVRCATKVLMGGHWGDVDPKEE